MSEQQKPVQAPVVTVGHHTRPGQYHSTMPRPVGNPARSGAANQPPRHSDGKFKKTK